MLSTCSDQNFADRWEAGGCTGVRCAACPAQQRACALRSASKSGLCMRSTRPCPAFLLGGAARAGTRHTCASCAAGRQRVPQPLAGQQATGHTRRLLLQRECIPGSAWRRSAAAVQPFSAGAGQSHGTGGREHAGPAGHGARRSTFSGSALQTYRVLKGGRPSSTMHVPLGRTVQQPTAVGRPAVVAPRCQPASAVPAARAVPASSADGAV